MKKKMINPWLSIWFDPEASMRFIIQYKPQRIISFFLFVGVILISTLITQSNLSGNPEVLVSFVVLGGTISFLILRFLFFLTGSWFGGSANQKEIDLFLGWSQMPQYWLFLLYIPAWLIYGENFWQLHNIDSSWESILSVLIGPTLIIFSLWAFIIWLHCLRTVQNFSLGKAILNFLCVIILFILIVDFISFIVVNSLSSFFFNF